MPEPSFNKQIGVLSIGRFWAYLIRFLTPVILVRLISKQEFGIYQQFLAITWFFPQFLTMGLDYAPYYFFPRINDKYNRSKFLFTNWILIFVIVLVISPLLFIFFENIISFWKDSEILVKYKTVAVAYIVFMVLATNLENIFVIEKKMRSLLTYLIINSVLRVVVILFTFIIYRTLDSIFYSLTFFEIVRTLFYSYYIAHNYYARKDTIFDRALAKEMLIYSLPLGYGVAIGNIARNIEKYLLPVFINVKEYAVYSVANFRIPYISVLLNSINNVTVIELTRIAELKNWNSVRELWHSIIVKQMLFIIPSICFFYIAAEQIITVLFTSRFLDAVPIFRILLFTFIPHTISPHVILRATGNTKKLGFIDLITFIVGVPGAYLLIKEFGLLGGAIAPVLIYLFNFILQNWVGVRIIKSNITGMWPYKRILIILVACFFAGSIQYLVNFFVIGGLIPLIRLILECLLFALIYLTSIHILKLYNVKWILNKAFSQFNSVFQKNRQ